MNCNLSRWRGQHTDFNMNPVSNNDIEIVCNGLNHASVRMIKQCNGNFHIELTYENVTYKLFISLISNQYVNCDSGEIITFNRVEILDNPLGLAIKFVKGTVDLDSDTSDDGTT